MLVFVIFLKLVVSRGAQGDCASERAG